MPTTYRFPVLVWRDAAGGYTAKLVEYEHNYYLIYGGKFFGGVDRAPTGYADNIDDAILQIKEFLAWSFDQFPWQPAPDFLDARLIHFRVEIRPEYRVEDRVYPCDEPLPLQLACVYGRQASGLLVCALPTIGVRFYYYEEKSLKELVNHYVQDRLKGMSPQELSRFLPPKEISLEGIVLHIPEKVKPRKYRSNIANLESVAEALADRGLRKQFSRAWEREREIADLINRIDKERANVLLVGETGVGKTTLLVEAAHQIERQIKVDEDEEKQFKFWLTSGARLIAGMQYLGQWEGRCESILEELAEIGGALCINNLLDLVRMGGSSPTDSIAAFFIPYLQRGELRLIAECAPAELDACRRLLPGLVDLFQILKVPAFDRDRAILVLNRAASVMKQNLNIEAEDGIGETVYRLFNRFAPYQSFPGKTVNFINELFDRAARAREKTVTVARVIDQFMRQTGLPELFLRDEIFLRREDVVKSLAEQVIGQPDACELAANIITTFKAGLNDPQRPIGVLLFCGPTGVGKTELAKAIARFCFGAGEQSDRLIRLDMSEYSGPRAATRLLGEPDGEPGDMIKKVRQQPFVVLLLVCRQQNCMIIN